MDALATFLASHVERPWRWGIVDCCLTLADWAVANGHADPANAWRGAYGDEAAWRRIVVARGGLLPLVSDVCARAALSPAPNAVRGTIGVIGARRNIEHQFGAIFDGERWQVRAPEGFGPLIAPVLGLWSVV